jgi:thioredoxin reductase
VLRAPYVVLALGRRGTPRRLGVPGELLTKVMYEITDAQSYQNKHMLVVGGGGQPSGSRGSPGILSP